MVSRIIFYSTFIILVSACTREKKECITTTTDYVNTGVSIDYATNFDLLKTNVGYSLQILNPENGEIEKTHSLITDVKYKIISLSATLNGMVSILSQQDQLVGINSKNHVYDSIILLNITNNNTQSFGDESNVSLEKIIASGANIVFYNGYGDQFPNEDKLSKLGVIVIPIYDWREQNPLGKAEWIKLIGVITGKEEEAKNYFRQITSQYESILSITDTISIKPTTLSGSLYGDIWFAPGGNSYFSRLLKDAGANYVYSDSKGTSSQEFSMEKILKENIDTEYWINTSMPTKDAVLKSNPKVRYLKSFSNNSYCYSSNMNLFWERSAAMPHVVLKDLVRILHPELELEGELYFYAKVN